jgi:hypothetical protein
MNVTQVGRRRPALLAAAALGLIGFGLLVRCVVVGAGLEVVLAALALVAGASLITLLTDRDR